MKTSVHDRIHSVSEYSLAEVVRGSASMWMPPESRGCAVLDALTYAGTIIERRRVFLDSIGNLAWSVLGL